MKKWLLVLAGTLASTAALAADSLTGIASKPEGFRFSSIGFLVIFVAIFYFLLIRPQMKRNKTTRQMLGSLGVGDEVVTQGGIIGKVEKMDDTIITLTIAENIMVKFQKQAVASVLPKGTVKQ